MRDFTLTKLWELRAELDNAIISKNYNKIKEIKTSYLFLVQKEKDFSHAFICYSHAFRTTAESGIHNRLNIKSILSNIEAYEKKYVYGEDVSLKLKPNFSTGFLAGDIWVLRAMYDKFLLNSVKDNDELQTEQNMILGKVVLDTLCA